MFRRLAAAWKPRWKSTTSHKICKHLRHHCAALERLVEMGLSPQASIPGLFLSDVCGSAKSHQALWQLPSWNWGSQSGSSPLGQLACQRGRVLRKNPCPLCLSKSKLYIHVLMTFFSSGKNVRNHIIYFNVFVGIHSFHDHESCQNLSYIPPSSSFPHLFPKDGRAEMAAAEAEAFSSGEPILHVSRDVFKRSLTLEMGSLEVFIEKKDM